MARPKKVSSDDMIKIVDSYLESHGDVSKLKASNLETYAATLGIDVKAYDFRRDDAVRRRIEKLNATGAAVGIGALAYKNLDTDALIYNNPTAVSLKKALLELDATWRDVYERAVALASENTNLLSAGYAKKQEIERLAAELNSAYEQLKDSDKSVNVLRAENRYLKAALERYLYPAVANEILLRDGVLLQADTEVTAKAMDELVGGQESLSLSVAVSNDSTTMSKSDELIAKMKSQMQESKHEK